MRIISGKLGGRNFSSPKGSRTHPMSEKVRGALFNALGDIEGLSVLDTFAGSGALSFEAISRGAKKAVAIDVDKSAHQTLQQNVNNLGISNQIKAVRANARGWSDNNPHEQFDIVLLDPPHDNLQPNLLSKLVQHAKQNGVVVMSLPPDILVFLPTTCHLLASKKYGDIQLVFYRQIK